MILRTFRISLLDLNNSKGKANIYEKFVSTISRLMHEAQTFVWLALLSCIEVHTELKHFVGHWEDKFRIHPLGDVTSQLLLKSQMLLNANNLTGSTISIILYVGIGNQ